MFIRITGAFSNYSLQPRIIAIKADDTYKNSNAESQSEALAYALTEHMSAAMLTEIHKRLGEYLDSKNDYQRLHELQDDWEDSAKKYEVK